MFQDRHLAATDERGPQYLATSSGGPKGLVRVDADSAPGKEAVVESLPALPAGSATVGRRDASNLGEDAQDTPGRRRFPARCSFLAGSSIARVVPGRSSQKRSNFEWGPCSLPAGGAHSRHSAGRWRYADRGNRRERAVGVHEFVSAGVRAERRDVTGRRTGAELWRSGGTMSRGCHLRDGTAATAYRRQCSR